MARPQIIVNVSTALTRRGAPTDTGPAFMAYSAVGATGPAVPTKIRTRAEAVAASVSAPYLDYVSDALDLGCPEVWVVRAGTVDPETQLQAFWDTALGLFSNSLGPGQVLIPGVTSAASHAALLAHAFATGRTVLMDGAKNATASTLAAAATALAASNGAERAGWPAPWVTVPGSTAGTTRDVPGSVIAAGLAARGDAFAGHANNAPAGDQGRAAGVVEKGLAVTATFTNTEQDTLDTAGVSVIKPVTAFDGKPTLYGWRSLSSDARFRQLNVGRMLMQLGVGINETVEKFLFRQIDGQGHLFAELEGALRGYLQPLWIRNALYGAEADDAFDVDVSGVNTPTTIQAGELRAAVAANLTPHTERVVIDVVTTVAA